MPDIVVGVIMAILAGFGLWRAVKLWRDPRQVDSVMPFRSILPFGPKDRSGVVRGSVPLAGGLLLVALGLIVFGLAKPAPKHPTPGAVAAVILMLTGVVLIYCHFSIVWFNRPAWMIPPHMRVGSSKPRDTPQKAAVNRLLTGASSPGVQVKSADARPIIVISRTKRGSRDKFRSYGIVIDDKLSGKIKRGERVELPVPVGKHVVYMKIDWCRSVPVEVELTSGAVLELTCAPGSSGVNADNYIELTPA